MRFTEIISVALVETQTMCKSAKFYNIIEKEAVGAAIVFLKHLLHSCDRVRTGGIFFDRMRPNRAVENFELTDKNSVRNGPVRLQNTTSEKPVR